MLTYKKLFFISIISLWSFISFSESSKDIDISTISPFNCFDPQLQNQLKLISKKEPFVNVSKCEEQCKSKGRNAVILLNDVFTKSLKKINFELKLASINRNDQFEVKLKPEIEHSKIQNDCSCSTKNLRIFATPPAISVINALKTLKVFDIGGAVKMVLEHDKLKGCTVRLNVIPKKDLVDKSGVKVKQIEQKSLANKSGKIVLNKPKSKSRLGRRSRDEAAKKMKEHFEIIHDNAIKLLALFCASFLFFHIFINPFSLFKDLIQKSNDKGVNPVFWVMAFFYFFGTRRWF